MPQMCCADVAAGFDLGDQNIALSLAPVLLGDQEHVQVGRGQVRRARRPACVLISIAAVPKRAGETQAIGRCRGGLTANIELLR
jgi:hypothetical protein